MTGMMFCHGCGNQIHSTAPACPQCGAPQRSATPANVSEKRRIVAFLLCWFFGIFGVHRFYVGKVGTGILQLLTVGGLGIWALIDWIVILVGGFTDSDGKKVSQW